MRFVHLTDLHLTSLAGVRLRELRGKRWLGCLSWRRRRHRQHTAPMLAEVMDAARALRPEHWLLTGDLVHIGLRREIEAAGRWLRENLEPAQTLLVPGNHDIYARGCWAALVERWAPWLHLPEAPLSNAPEARYPIVCERDGIAFIGLNSALPTAALSARGRLGDEQRRRLRSVLADVHARGLFSCLLIHHPPLPGLTHWRKALADVAQLRTDLGAAGPALVLHGHEHHDMDAMLGSTRVFATASASSARRDHPAAFRVFDVQRDGIGWQIEMRLLRAAGAGVFATAAREHWRWSTTALDLA